jgi:hypothetical protein
MVEDDFQLTIGLEWSQCLKSWKSSKEEKKSNCHMNLKSAISIHTNTHMYHTIQKRRRKKINNRCNNRKILKSMYAYIYGCVLLYTTPKLEEWKDNMVKWKKKIVNRGVCSSVYNNNNSNIV